MCVLITGDEGFIGNHLADAYRKKGTQILGWGRNGVRMAGKEDIHADLMNPADAEKIFNEFSPSLILHCAGSADVNKSIADPILDLENNYITTHNLLFAMKKLQMSECRFVLMSSAAIYGNPVSLPITERQNPNPLSPYALHKKAAEDVCLFMHRNYGLDTKILRIFSAYGPGLKKQLFWDMYQKAAATGELNLWGSGEESRDYIYIDDLIHAIMLVAGKAPHEEVVYNVANCEEVTIKRAASAFAGCLGIGEDKIHFAGKRREGDPINWKGDITRLLSLGYVRKVGFEEGVEKYIRWANNINI